MKTAGVTFGGVIAAIFLNLIMWLPVLVIGAFLINWMAKPETGGFARYYRFAAARASKRNSRKEAKRASAVASA